MSEFSDLAATLLEDAGEAVTYQAAEGSAVAMSAVVSRFGRGSCPAGWPADSFPGFARHAAFRVPAEAADGTAIPEPEAGAKFVLDGVAYTIGEVVREPVSGSHGLWWICRCAAQARGKY
jgi:hypothetical protein